MAEIHQIYVFEVAHSINLDLAEGLVGGGSARQAFRHRGREAAFLRLDPAPLRLAQERTPLTVGQWTTDALVDVVLYDFGTATVVYRISIDGALGTLRAGRDALRQSTILRSDARQLMLTVLGSLAPAISRPSLLDFGEDYTIIGVRDLPEGASATEFVERHAEEIALILRPEAEAVSGDEIRNTTEARISFGPRDVTIVDWDAAFVLDPAPEDVRAVLEFANVQLLEMRWLDLQLDRALARAYSLLAGERRWRARIPPLQRADVSIVAELQLEGAVMLERVSNAIKVFGEEYLTRIYRLAAARFQLAGLEGTLTNKLATVENIYQKMSDRAATLRLEALEWIVIVLIALEIVLSFLH